MNAYKIEYDPAEFWRLADDAPVPDWSEITVDLERVDGLAGELADLIPETYAALRPFSLWPAAVKSGLLAGLFVALFAAGLFCGREYQSHLPQIIRDTDVDAIYLRSAGNDVHLAFGQITYAIPANVARAIGEDLVAGAEKIEAVEGSAE